MYNSYDQLAKLLCAVPEYTAEGRLNKNIIAELARKYDTGFINKLLADKSMKKLFFSDSDAGLIFKKDIFLQFISQKEFLPDSYTIFEQKIGLASGGTMLRNDGRVVLNWPYKDCVLEGGQTKEDTKRNEMFFNEILAPDEINTIFEDKVFTSWKRYDKDGEHELDELQPNDNLIIKGNNLIVLHSLLKRFGGKIKLIYIDPPYNTGNDSFSYNDSFNHSTWLTFMKNRLEVAWKLLNSEGAIFIQCDDNEQAYLKVLCDEVFQGGFKNTIAVKMSEASGMKMAHENTRFPKLKEYIHFYAKSGFKGFEAIDKYRSGNWDNENNIFLSGMTNEIREEMNRTENTITDKNTMIERLNKILKDVKLVPLAEELNKHVFKNEEDKTNWLFNNSYRIIKTAGSVSISKQLKEKYPTIQKDDQDIKAEISPKGIIYYYISHFNRETASPRVQVLFADANAFNNPCDFWQDIKTTGAIANEGGVQLKNGKKPEKLLQRIIRMCSKPGDIVMDYHLGSGTTAAVAHKMGRQYVGIEQLHYGDNDSVKRLQTVINGDKTGISEDENWKGGGSFVYCDLKNDANEFRKKVQAADDKKMDDLLDEALHSSFLSYRIDAKNHHIKLGDFHKLSLTDKKHVLLDLIDNNALYVNYSEIDDETYRISDEDKKHNKAFYGE